VGDLRAGEDDDGGDLGPVPCHRACVSPHRPNCPPANQVGDGSHSRPPLHQNSQSVVGVDGVVDDGVVMVIMVDGDDGGVVAQTRVHLGDHHQWNYSLG